MPLNYYRMLQLKQKCNARLEMLDGRQNIRFKTSYIGGDATLRNKGFSVGFHQHVFITSKGFLEST
jgi:hypothetical protein